MDVASETGPEAIVRTLLQAMEHPNSPAKPLDLRKLWCEIGKFSFPGVLQDLEIAIDYEPYLP